MGEGALKEFGSTPTRSENCKMPKFFFENVWYLGLKFTSEKCNSSIVATIMLKRDA